MALKAHDLLKCRGVTRSDFRFYKDKFYLLETNTQPGMTSPSLILKETSLTAMTTFFEFSVKKLSSKDLNKFLT